MRRCHDRHRRCARCVASSGGPGEHAERLSGIVRNLFRRHPDPWTLYLGSGFAPPFDYTDFLGRFAAAFGRDSLIGRPYRTTAPDDALIGSFERLLLSPQVNLLEFIMPEVRWAECSRSSAASVRRANGFASRRFGNGTIFLTPAARLF